MCSLILYFFFVFSISSHSWAFLQCSSVTFEDGKKYQLLDSRGQVKFVTEEEDCEVLLNVLLVGGGGDGDIFEGHAGGSGFVDFKQVVDGQYVIQTMKNNRCPLILPYALMLSLEELETLEKVEMPQL